MAPQLDAAQRVLIKTLLTEGFQTRIIASKALCSVRAVQRIRLETEQSEMPSQRLPRAGRHSCLTSTMQKALRDILTKQSYLYRFEMADALLRKFGKKLSERSIGRTLRSIGWPRKTIHRIAQQRDANLRDYYLHRISQCKSYQLVFINESSCDKRAGYHRWGWFLKRSSPVEITKFGYGKRWHILPAYAQDGILLRRVYQGSTETEVFKGFIA
jgi:transposase